MTQVRSRVVTRGTARRGICKTTTAVKRICQSVELDEQSFIHITIAEKLVLRIVGLRVEMFQPLLYIHVVHADVKTTFGLGETEKINVV